MDGINAYFTEGKLSEKLMHIEKGSFVYEIELYGKKYKVQQPSVNDESGYAYASTYSEIEDLDKKLVDLGVEKSSSSKNYEFNTLDKEYVDRFLRIVENK